MKAFLLKILSTASLALGSWVIRFIAWWIATGYFLLPAFKEKLQYRALSGHLSGSQALGIISYCAWRQFHSFAGTYADRIEVYSNKRVTASAQGREKLVEAGRRGTGGIILISHMGNYEVAARAFQELGLRLLIIMGEKEAKQVARDQRETLMARGVRIHVATAQDASPFGRA